MIALLDKPMILPSGWLLWLVVPLCLSVAIVYKTIRTDNLRRLALEVAALVAYMLAGLAALAVVLWLIVDYWP